MTIFVRCSHCGQPLLVAPKSLVRCPHCKGKSSVGGSSKTRGLISLIVGLVFLGLGIGITVFTYENAEPGGMYFIYIGGFITGVASLLASFYYCCFIPQSQVSAQQQIQMYHVA